MMMMFHGCVIFNNGREWKSIPKFNFPLQSELITFSMFQTNYILRCQHPTATQLAVVVLQQFNVDAAKH